MRYNIKSEKGIGLIETIAALALAIIVITTLVSLSVATLRSSVQSKLLLQSTKLASEETELVRAYRDSRTWAVFTSDMSSCFSGNCYMNGLAVASGTQVINPSTPMQITRYFTLSYPISGNTNVVRVSVSINWTVGGDAKSTHTYTDLSNWRGL